MALRSFTRYGKYHFFLQLPWEWRSTPIVLRPKGHPIGKEIPVGLLRLVPMCDQAGRHPGAGWRYQVIDWPWLVSREQLLRVLQHRPDFRLYQSPYFAMRPTITQILKHFDKVPERELIVNTLIRDYQRYANS